MASKDAEKQLPQTCVHSPTTQIKDSASQEVSVKKVRYFKSMRYQPVRLRLLLAFVSFGMILGVVLINSAQVCSLADLSQYILKTFRNDIEPLSLHMPHQWSRDSNPNKISHHDEAVFDAPGQTNLKTGRLSMDVVKRAMSNSTVPREELQTAPLNTPSTVTSPLPTSSSATTQITSLSSTLGRTTILATESSTPSNTILTLTTQTSSSLPSESSSGSPELTTITGKSSSNELSTSSVKITSSPVSTTLAQQTIYTTTLPDGGVSTLTSTTIIQTAIEPTSEVDPTKTRGSPSLQTNIAKKIQQLAFGQAMGMIGVAIVNTW